MTTTSCNEVDVTTASQWINAGHAVLVDVREPAEHASSHIPQATLMPLSRIKSESLASPPHRSRKLIVHCQAGGRSAQVARQWTAQGDMEVYSMTGGINEWKSAGLPVAQSTQRPRLDVQRQLQITIGLGVLTGVTLGAFVSPWFLVLAGVFGAGLTLAGITGLCPLAMLIAKMPWNQRAVAGANAAPAKGASCCAIPTAADAPAASPLSEADASCCSKSSGDPASHSQTTGAACSLPPLR